MKKTIYLMCVIALICVGVAFGTTPASVSGNPSIYDNWDTSVYEDSLVAFYRFDNESTVGENDTVVYDWSGNANNGSVTGAVYNLTNKVLGDGAMQFNGTDNFVSVPEIKFDNLTSENFTISFWFNPLSKTISFLGDSTQNFAGYIRYETDRFKVELDNTGLEVAHVQSIDLGSWFHFAIVRNSTHIIYYDNGITDDLDIYVGDNFTINSIGEAYFNQDMNGSIDEVMIWNRSLSASEILDIYNQTNRNQVKAYENMSVISSATLLKEDYNLTDPEANGVIIIGDDDITLDCNGASLVGNGTATSYGIRSSAKKNLTIKNCNISYYKHGIYASDNGATSKGLNINNVTIFNVTKDAILILCINESKISNSVLYNTGGIGHGIYFSEDVSCKGRPFEGASVYNSTIFNVQSGIQYNSVNGRITTGVINNNIIYGIRGSGIAMNTGNKINITNNTIYNFTNRGIGLFYDSTLSGIINSSAINIIIENNNITNNLGNSNYFIGNYTVNNTIRNNNYNNLILDIYLQAFSNFIINETMSDNLLLNLSTTPTFNNIDSTILFNYNGRKDLRVVNNTITINNMPTSFNQFFNGTIITPTFENFNSGTTGIGASAYGFVFSYLTATQPNFNTIATTITDMSYTHTPSLKTLIITCTGSGSSVLTNMNSIKGDDGFYNVNRDGTALTKSESNTYTTTGCSTWTFSSSDTAVKSTTDDIIQQLQNISPWIGIILIVAISSILLFIIKGEMDPDAGIMAISALVLAVIAVGIILTVSILILTELGTA